MSVAIFQSAEFTLGTVATAVIAVAATMIGIGLLAAVGPPRRGLSIDASEALKADS